MTDDLFNLMASRGLTRSRRHFSTELLGTAHNYATSNRSGRPSDSAMLHLIRWLYDRHRYILAIYCLQMLVWPNRPDRKLWWRR
jgi:hypothetical protein